MSEPQLGEAFVCRATAEHGVEWVVIAPAENPGGPVLVVPADTSPLAGSADVVVPASEAGSPLTLRGRFSLWVRPSLLLPELKVRTVAPETCRSAAATVEALLNGSLRGEPLAREVDEDYDMQLWLAQEIAPAHRALAVASAGLPASEVERGESARPTWGLQALAATLAAASIGLGIWALSLHQEVLRLAGPIGNVDEVVIDVGDTTRGPQPLELPPGAEHFLLVVQLPAELRAYPAYRVELRDAGTGALLAEKDGLLLLQERELSLFVPVPRRQQQVFEMRLSGVTPESATLLGRQTFTVKRGKGSEP